MSRQHVQNERLKDMDVDEEEPIFVADQKKIVLIWPDQRVQSFPWSVLRRLVVPKGTLAASREERTDR